MTMIVLNGEFGALDVDHPIVVLTAGHQDPFRPVVFVDGERMTQDLRI